MNRLIALVFGGRNALARARLDARLRAATADELAAEIRRAVAQWERFPSARDLLAHTKGWTDGELAEKLDALLAEITEDDRREGRSGRETSFFDFYDLGLARIREILALRAERRASPASPRTRA